MARQRTKRRARQPVGITEVRVRGFKSLGGEEDHRIQIRPLTLLAGANSSGKSSAIQPLLLLKQTLESGFDPGPLRLHDTHVRFTRPDQILWHSAGQKPVKEFRIGLELDGSSHLVNVFRLEKTKRRGKAVSDFKLHAMEYAKGDDSFVLRSGTDHQEIVRFVGPLDELRKELEERMGRSLRWRVLRRRCFFGLDLYDPSGDSSSLFPGTLLPGPLTPGLAFEDRLREIIHVPGLRGNPTRSYQTTAVGKMFPGTFESYVASIVSHWQENDRDRLTALGNELESLGLTWKVQAEEIDATQVELKVGRLPHAQQGGARDLVNIADVGFGVSQTLPIVVALLTAERGRLVYLEQPEIHLHPRAQVALATLIADAAKRGVRVVAETHSSLLLVALQSLVAEGFLPPKDVILHWFRRNDDGVTRITTAELDDKGAYGDWPEDFGEVTLDTEGRYLDAVGAFT